jgi:putative ABC transport system permease protein
MKIAKTAWRNMWRNRTRTIISATAILVSSLVVSLLIAFQEGFVNDMKSNVINDVTGDVRIMNETYVKNERIMPLQFCVSDTESILGKLKESPLVADATPRTEFGVSIYRDGNQIACRAVGIDFATSRIIRSKTTKLVAGSLPSPGTAEVAITAGMANELGLKPGDKFTALTRTATNGTNGKTFTVTGVILLSDTDYANRVFFLDWLAAGEYLRMGRNALQIQVFLNKPADADAATPKIRALLPAGELDAKVWHSVKGIYSFLAMADFMYAIIASIFYVLASTVIFNTTMMSVLERKREIGTLGALGMEPGKIVALFLSESVLIATVGSIAGLVAGFTIVQTVGRVGIDIGMMGGKSISGMGFSQVIYPSLSAYRYAFIFAIGLAISFLASWLPARMAARIEPAAALADR